MCVCVCEFVPVSLIEQVGPLCMGSRQPVRHTADCGHAQHAVCGSQTLWLDVDTLSGEFPTIHHHFFVILDRFLVNSLSLKKKIQFVYVA